jgi:hypothetical protein
MRIPRRVLVAAPLVLAGCGLLDALDKFNSISFQLPSRTYSVSTTDPRWRSPPATGIPELPCGMGAPVADCCTAPIDCTKSPLVCQESKCALKFDYEEHQTVDLGKEVPELAAQKGNIVSQVLLKQIDLQMENGLNVTTPPVSLFLAPANVTSASHASARRIATIPTQPAGFKGPVQIPLDAAAQQTFSNFARDFQTPFNFITSTSVLVKSGEPTPMGKITVTVSGVVEAKL